MEIKIWILYQNSVPWCLEVQSCSIIAVIVWKCRIWQSQFILNSFPYRIIVTQVRPSGTSTLTSTHVSTCTPTYTCTHTLVHTKYEDVQDQGRGLRATWTGQLQTSFSMSQCSTSQAAWSPFLLPLSSLLFFLDYFQNSKISATQGLPHAFRLSLHLFCISNLSRSLADQKDSLVIRS